VPTHAARFLAGASEQSRLPPAQLPEVAFAGRSNVGKSSLLNRLVGRRGLARVGKTPGRTQQINFFLVDDRVVFVDLPGYGFARVPLAVRDEWKDLVEGYIERRATLCAVVVVVDLRRGLEAEEEQLLEYLRVRHVSTILVATKADKLSHGRRLGAMHRLTLAVPGSECIACSAATGSGIADLWQAIERRVAGATAAGRQSKGSPRER
jgi:GTP-binding protein